MDSRKRNKFTEIVEKIKETEDELAKLKKIKTDLEDEKRRKIIKKYPILYVIECIATGNVGYMSYLEIKSCFTTKIKAENALQDKKIVETRKHVFKYRIRPEESENLSNDVLDNLDGKTNYDNEYEYD